MVEISGSLIARLRTRLHLTQREFADAAGMSEVRIRKIEKQGRTSILPRNFRRLAETLKMDQAALLLEIGQQIFEDGMGAGIELVKKSQEQDAKRAKKSGIQTEIEDRSIELGSEVQLLAEVPLFDLSVAAGTWTDVSDVEGVALTDDQIRQGLFRVRLAGDSMKPDYQNGEVIEFRCLRIAHEGPVEGADYYVQKNDGTATFKRLADMDEDSYTLVAVNVKKYNKPLVVARQEVVRMARAVAKVTLIDLKR